MLDFCKKSGYFSGTRKRHEISMLSEGPSIILGKSYRMLLQQKQADPVPEVFAISLEHPFGSENVRHKYYNNQ
jgi:hypothetical protein